MLGTALYYPHIDITDPEWLKSAILFWDEIQTIVPATIEHPYCLPETEYCANEGYLKPLHCDQFEEVLDDLGSMILSFIKSNNRRSRRTLLGPLGEALYDSERLADDYLWRMEDAVRIHPSKMDPVMRNVLTSQHGAMLLSNQKMAPRLRRALLEYDNREGYWRDGFGEWLLVSREFADLYMSALAAMLAREIELSPLTNERSSAGVNLHCLGDNIVVDGPNSARGALVSIVMKGLRIDPDVPINRVLEFRQRRQGQLDELSGMFDNLKKSIEASEEGRQIESNATRVYENEVRPALKKLKNELKNESILSGWNGFQAAAAYSAVPSTALWATGIASAPVTLGIGAFITAAGVGVKSYLANSKVRSKSPYTYLLDIERRFSIPD